MESGNANLRSLACVCLAMQLLCSAVEASSLDDALIYASKHSAKADDDLIALASIPSISSLPEHLDDSRKAAQWLEKKLKRIGLQNVQLVETVAQPIVYGDWLLAEGQPTALIYGHYDVQPVEPVEAWQVPPFQPVLANGSFWGRGVSDDKGGLLQAVHAVEAFLQSSGTLPVNVKFMLEGQEEVGSWGLEATLVKTKELFAADYALSADGGQLTPEQGSILLGLRGGVAAEVTLQTVVHDLHSGMKGGQVLNPIVALTRLAASLHHENGTIAVPGFYDAVAPITEADETDMVAADLDEAAEMAALGAKGAFGEAGFSTLARRRVMLPEDAQYLFDLASMLTTLGVYPRWLRPTLELVGIYGGVKDGIKTIVPATATLKMVARLVPNQKPAEVLEAIEAHVRAHTHELATLTFTKMPFAADPYFTARDTAPNAAAAKVLEEVLGNKPKYVREGGSIPAMAMFKKHLGIETTVFGFGLDDDFVHAPNERMRHSFFTKGREAYIKLLYALGGAGAETAADTAKSSKDEL